MSHLDRSVFMILSCKLIALTSGSGFITQLNLLIIVLKKANMMRLAQRSIYAKWVSMRSKSLNAYEHHLLLMKTESSLIIRY
jgi:hypothetical protein